MTPKTQDQPANIAAPEVKGGSAATIGSAYYRLFEHMSRTHDLTLTDSELADICNVVEAMIDRRCQWGSCSSRATHQDKTGMLLCTDCVKKATAYTCGIVPLNTQNSVISGDDNTATK